MQVSVPREFFSALNKSKWEWDKLKQKKKINKQNDLECCHFGFIPVECVQRLSTTKGKTKHATEREREVEAFAKAFSYMGEVVLLLCL